MGVDMVFADIDWEDAPDGDCFHLNWAGMRRALDHMASVGMLTPEMTPPKWGTVPDEMVRAAVYHDAPGIPPHKFGSNDDWHVVPAECSSAVALWNRAPEQTRAAVLADMPHFAEWVAYLSRATRRGGFLVG